MDIQLFRIDDRLIHGQVVIGWASYLKTKNIILCDNDIAQNDWEKELYLSIVPEGMTSQVFNTTELARSLKDENNDFSKTIILVNSPILIEELLDLGVTLDKLNIGGIHFRQEREKYLPYLYLDKNEIDSFLRIIKKGVSCDCQDVPNAKAISLKKILS